jgi:hypothetical protein
MLRNAVLGIAIVALLVGLLLLGAGLFIPGGWLLFNGAVLLLATLFERWRYKATQTPQTARGSATGERFIDPETGALMEVYYDAATGERSYVKLNDKSAT